MTQSQVQHGAAPSEGRADALAGLDLWLLGAAAVLTLFGLLAISSASVEIARKLHVGPNHFFLRQSVGVVLGVGAGLVVWRVPWRMLQRSGLPVYIGALLLLLLVWSPLGVSAKGATRWVNLGLFNLQPSEYAKLALCLVVATFLSRNADRVEDFFGVTVPVIVLFAAMAGIVFVQKDLGTTALLMGITGVGLFVAGTPLRTLASLGAAGAGLGAIGIYIEPFRLERLANFMHPERDMLGAGYQVVQGWVALSEGGLTGRGLGLGLAQHGYLPEPHTDMILAVIAEELGVFGWLTVFALHGIVLARGMQIAARASDLYGTLLAGLVSSLLAAQVIINAAVIGGLVPPKGLVLPFISYGASAVLAHWVAIALLLRVGQRTHDVSHGVA